jgi:hypothetical protein
MKQGNKRRELQKFKANGAKGPIDKILLNLINGEKLTLDQIAGLSEADKKKVAEIFTGGVMMLKDRDRDTFLEKIEAVLSDESRRELWERNHTVIIGCIDYLMRQKNRMPTPTEVSVETGLSRQTIYNHLKAYSGSNDQKEKQQTIAVLRETMIAKVYSLGIDGDMRAAKIFMDSTEPKEPRENIKNQQNNFIQINGMTISQKQLSQLPEEKQQQLAGILSLISG